MTDDETIVLAVRHNIHGETTDAQAIAFAQEIRRAALEEAAKEYDELEKLALEDMEIEKDVRFGVYAKKYRLAARRIRALSQKDPQ